MYLVWSTPVFCGCIGVGQGINSSMSLGIKNHTTLAWSFANIQARNIPIGLHICYAPICNIPNWSSPPLFCNWWLGLKVFCIVSSRSLYCIQFWALQYLCTPIPRSYVWDFKVLALRKRWRCGTIKATINVYWLHASVGSLWYICVNIM